MPQRPGQERAQLIPDRWGSPSSPIPPPDATLDDASQDPDDLRTAAKVLDALVTGEQAAPG